MKIKRRKTLTVNGITFTVERCGKARFLLVHGNKVACFVRADRLVRFLRTFTVTPRKVAVI